MAVKDLYYSEDDHLLFTVSCYASYSFESLNKAVDEFVKETKVDKSKVNFFEIKESNRYKNMWCLYTKKDKVSGALYSKLTVVDNMDKFIR